LDAFLAKGSGWSRRLAEGDPPNAFEIA